MLEDRARGEGARVERDGGVRRGQDVFKAIALGANAVAVGRPLMYGLALGGSEGVKSVYDKLKQELTSTMQAAGAGKVSDITRAFVARAEG